jgi:DNA-binding NtrC family response regulator
MDPSKVLVIGNEPARLSQLVQLLRRASACPVLADQSEQAANQLDAEDIALIALAGSHAFCDPFLRAFALLHAKHALPPLVIFASDSSEAFAVCALRAGAQEYLPGPFEYAALLKVLARWLPECAVAPADAELTGGEAFVGSSPAMQAIRLQIRRVAATDCNVLITGETGTGKEVVAQLIHRNSARSRNPLVCINCAAIPDSLLESELFGYERGAFTGAARANQGKLMAANHGTVFFDEVGDMSPLAQAKVLRAIETKEVQRLGAEHACGTDIRIVAATHRNFDDLQGPESFRRDLYFRLNVGRIFLPPLRERKGDLGALVERIIADLNRKSCRHIEGVSVPAMRRLAQYDWPGNVRELKNVIERAFIVRDGGLICPDDLSPSFAQEQQRKVELVQNEDLRCIQEALSVCHGNKSKAAERLNWSRMTLYRKLAKYGRAEEAGSTATDSSRPRSGLP